MSDTYEGEEEEVPTLRSFQQDLEAARSEPVRKTHERDVQIEADAPDMSDINGMSTPQAFRQDSFSRDLERARVQIVREESVPQDVEPEPDEVVVRTRVRPDLEQLEQ